MNDNRIEQTIKPYYTPMFRDDAPSFLWDILVVLLSKHKKNYVENMLCDIAINSVDDLRANLELVLKIGSQENLILMSITQALFEFLLSLELPHECIAGFLEQTINCALAESNSVSRFSEILIDKLVVNAPLLGVNGVKLSVRMLEKIEENATAIGIDARTLDRIEYLLSSGSHTMHYVIEHVKR